MELLKVIKVSNYLKNQIFSSDSDDSGNSETSTSVSRKCRCGNHKTNYEKLNIRF